MSGEIKEKIKHGQKEKIKLWAKIKKLQWH